MTNVPIIKAVKAGKSIDSVNPFDWLFHSDHTAPKKFIDDIYSMTVNPGDTEKTITIPHGLNYVPVHFGFGGDDLGIYTAITPLPYRVSNPGGWYEHTYIHADATNIYITWKSSSPYNQLITTPYSLYDDTRGWGYALAGNVLGSGKKCLIAFNNGYIARGQSISHANLDFYISHKNIPNQDVKIRTYGVNVDELTDPLDLGQSETPHYTDNNVAAPQGSFTGIDVTEQIRDIINRANWVSFSSFGIYVKDHDSIYDRNIMDDDFKSILTITLPGSQVKKFRLVVFKDKVSD